MNIIEVNRFNLDEEIMSVERSICCGAYLAVDTEYPGFILNTPREASSQQVYSELKYNVDRLNPVQFGFTVFSLTGQILGTWQFNFANFDPNLTDEERQISSISLEKRRSGIDFKKQRTDGIDSFDFAHKFGIILGFHQPKLKWVFFHGNYDLGYMLKIITNSSLPETSLGFQIRAGEIFDQVYDIKCIVKSYIEGDLSLNRLSNILGVNRTGPCHQAGSDSLLTARVFLRMREEYQFDEKNVEGIVYGILGRISRRMPKLIQLVPQPIRLFPQPIPLFPQPNQLVPQPIRFVPAPIRFVPAPIRCFQNLGYAPGPIIFVTPQRIV